MCFFFSVFFRIFACKSGDFICFIAAIATICKNVHTSVSKLPFTFKRKISYNFLELQSVPMPLEEKRSSGLEGRIQRLEDEVPGMGSEVRKMRADLEELKAVNSAILPH